MGRTAKFTIVGAMLAFTLAATLWFAGGDDASTPPSGGHRIADPTAGLSAVTPPGWFTTVGAEPANLASRFGKRIVSDEDGCDRSDFTIVWLTIREGDAPDTALPVVSRPAHFTARDGSGIQSGFGDQSCELRSQTIRFTDSGRTFSADLTFGRDAAHRRIDQAYAILNSLQVSKVAPSPWKTFCRAAEQLDLSRKDLASDSRFPKQLRAMREASPSPGVAHALQRAIPVATNPTASKADAVAVEHDLSTIGDVLAQHCNQPLTYFRWLYGYLGSR